MCDVKVAFIEFLCQVLPISTIKFFKHPTKTHARESVTLDMIRSRGHDPL